MKPGDTELKLFLVDLDMKWDHALTSPSFSDALAFHSRMFISSEPLRTYLLSADHLTQMTCCIRLVWYTSLRIVGNHIESQKRKDHQIHQLRLVNSSILPTSNQTYEMCGKITFI